ncbi:MAG: glycosyltransferase family 1 protein [Candidatus Aminicenantes bacterium]|nr:glycosyltransferase family 1 protein [Candidatus Aminicenantes bacterium]
MRIGFDLRPFLREETGVGVYFKNLLFELARLDADDEYVLFSASWKDRFPSAKLPPFKTRRFRDLRWPVKGLNFAWYRLGRPRLDTIFGRRMDLTHSPTPLILPTAGKKIVTVCDLFFMDFPGRADKEARRYFLKRTESSLRKADGIVTISEFTRKALIERFGLGSDKIKVTYLGLNDIFKEPAGAGAVEAARRKFDLPEGFLLFVGASEPRKNLPRLIDALAVIHERYAKIPLVLAGRAGADQAALLDRIRSRGLEGWVRRLGYLPDPDIRDLYHAASALVFPSYCEGFGLPLLEAMACGLPVAASGVSALPEIGGEVAVYFDPENVEDMAAKIILILADDRLRASLQAKGRERAKAFTWQKTARETLAFYREILART